jgi:DNA (cytosine-5)-methyltransferase 1
LDTQVNQSVIVAQRGRGEKGNTSQQLEPNTTNTLTSVQKDNMVMNGFQIRRLTEVECERLQGFPDNWTKFGNYDGVIKEISRTQRYKLCGNAVTVDIVELIARKILIALIPL